MTDQDIDTQLADVLGSFNRLRSTPRFTRAQAIEVIDLADEVIHRLLVESAGDMATAVKVADDQEQMIDRLRASNEKIASVCVGLYGSPYGTA